MSPPTYTHRYSELQPELHAYFNRLFVAKTAMMERVARALVRKLRVRVVKRRRAKAHEEEVLKRQQEGKGERAVVAQKTREMREVRRRLGEIEGRRWVCMRNGCDLRRFFSAGGRVWASEWG